MAATSLIVIIRKKYAKLVTNIEKDQIVLGWFNKIANKGAVSVKFQVSKKKVLFINCHLEAHQENREHRIK